MDGDIYTGKFTVCYSKGKWSVSPASGTLDSCSSRRVGEITTRALDEEFPEGPDAYEDALSLDFE